MNVVKTGRAVLFLSLVVMAMLLGQNHCLAKQDDNRPARSIFMAAEYPGVEVPIEENVSMDIIFHNKGKSDENMSVRIAEKPDGWTAKIKTYRFTVTAVHVPGGDDKTLTFEAQPDKDIQPGKYSFRIEAQTEDGKFKMDQNIQVTVTSAEEKSEEDRGVKLTTSYPVIRGPSDATFEFSVDVNSKLDKDAVFDLFANGPKGWDINFKPAYESKYITSLRLKSNQNQSIAVEVKPAMLADVGEYPINLRVSSGDAKGEAQLAVVLIGTYSLGVPTSRL